MRCKHLVITWALLAGSGIAPVRAGDLAEKGREIFDKSRHAVVTVEIVLKTIYSTSGQASAPTEAKQEATGTVVDPSGLTVLALSACDPSEMYQRMMSQQSRYKVDAEVSDVKILLADGAEVPAEIVLRDKDLDLAFIRPKAKPAAPMAAVDLSRSAPALVLDDVLTINRLNKAASRAYAASIEHIAAVVQKPRTFYVPDNALTATTLGSPAFLLNGKLLGVFVMRAVGSSDGGQYNYRQNVTSIILPAEDILKAARQAPEAKGDTDKKEAPDKAKEPGNAPSDK
jgi:hypothetical protein